MISTVSWRIHFVFLFFFFNSDKTIQSHFLKQDILEKIRECGSSVTYYGGRVLNNQSPEVSPMTKAIMREIHHSDNNICEVCHPNNGPHTNKLYTSFRDADKNHLGKTTGVFIFVPENRMVMGVFLRYITLLHILLFPSNF